MKLASYNVENFFDRPVAMNQPTLDAGKPILGAYNQINSLLAHETYSVKDKEEIVRLLKVLEVKNTTKQKYAILRENHGHLIKWNKGTPTVVADGRGSWIGWVDLVTEPVDETATRMTAKVIGEVDADVQALIEVENRPALKMFNEHFLKSRFEHVMVVDGNDTRGIDVGLMCRGGCEIKGIVSHVDDKGATGTVFCRDCPEYTIQVGSSEKVVVMVNHLKSKGYGKKGDSDARRKAEASRIREIYELRKSEGVRNVAIVGDFNDTPDSDPLLPLLGNGSDLKDISDFGGFQNDGRPGTYGNCAPSNKIDYILLSPSLFKRVKGGGIFRKGVWGGKNGTLFPHYSDITAPIQAASDHAVIWAEFDL